MIYSILIGVIAGMATGIGLVAVYSAVGLEAQIPMRSNTEGFEKWYGLLMGIGACAGSLLTSGINVSVRLSPVFCLLFCIIAGIFTGAVISSLTEVLNLLPILKHRVLTQNTLKYAVASFVIGKAAGGILYFIYFIERRSS